MRDRLAARFCRWRADVWAGRARARHRRSSAARQRAEKLWQRAEDAREAGVAWLRRAARLARKHDGGRGGDGHGS